MGSLNFPGVPGRLSYQRSQLEPNYDPSPQTLAMVDLTAQAANIAATTCYTTPNSAITKLYSILAYAVVINTPTAGTLPSISVKFTDADTGVVETIQVAASASSSAQGTNSQGVVVHSVSPGTAIQYMTGSYVAGSGTALQYALHIRIQAV